MVIQHFKDEVILSAEDNSAGTIIDSKGILAITNILIDKRNLTKSFIDDLIANHESETGYLIKANDFIMTLKPYIISDYIDFGCDWDEWKGEKDYEKIELLYGDYHSECGDR